MGPLALLLPSAVDLTADPGPFAPGLGIDATGLCARRAHADSWVVFPDLVPGDAIVWSSSIVYHTALPPADSVSPARRSVDVRLNGYRD